ncbi:branched-chain amino acid ABC transporter ATP-binding protein/permease [Rhodococcus sp. 14C212]|uniref:branched-chain amino acid ABC transporter ATP-binding protein/permease n=1 Tax=Rhodococcus sp. 14C212 TaxID=2711209 RepID=UPI0013EC15CD|nr:branched-chain amino acid ABC transporter ATP-binding protein/permease [Rhodococcus sp. 14C212]NGP04999.1 branched-chain amino acid ABC transporter ATP-binding protein/permease [Rhodococcus sp. 14C212]
MNLFPRLKIDGRRLWLLPLSLGVLVLLAPLFGLSAVNQRQFILVAVLALTVSGLNLAWGYGGELAIGQLAMYALGAYVTGWMVMEGYDLAFAMLASCIAAAALGLLTGLPALRVRGWGVAMASFFLIILIPDIIKLFEDQTGGQIGMIGIPGPVLFGQELSDDQFYGLVMLCLIVWLVLMRNLVTSRHGSALRVMRESPVLTASLGLDVRRLKLTIYVMAAIPAGLAGSLFVFVDRFIAPDYFDFAAAILIVAAAVLGGAETVYGAIVGAAILTILPQRFGSFDHYAEIVFGAFLLVGGILLTNTRLRNGLDSLKLRIRNWGSTPTARASTEAARVPELAPRALKVDSITKTFGGNTALNGVTIEAQPGQITALIGANGSGKTTMLNVISGFYPADSGTVSLEGEPLPLGKASQTARRGIARTFQTPIVPSSMTTEEAVEVARYVRDYCGIPSSMLRLPKHRDVARRDEDEAGTWLRATGLAHESTSLARGLSLGDRRMLEVARALATGASVLLLDEVASGLDPVDLDRLSVLLRAVRDAGGTVVLVEHNFRLVCDLADSIYVLERGELIAQGDPDAIQRDPAVARSYLGDELSSEDELASLDTVGSNHD